MLHRLILLVFLSTPVCAADFRTLNFGDTCAGAEEKEKTLGPVSVPWKQMPDADIHAFQVREYDRDLVITYLCPEGNLLTGNYSLPIEQFDDAAKTYRHTYGRLVSTYGSVVLDSSRSLVGMDIESLLGGPNRTKYSAAWQTSRASIMISIMPNQPSEVHGWRVFVVAGSTSK
jgi:hypothetical protein